MTIPAILITGGAKRLGAAMALHMAKLGYDVAITYQSSQEEAQHIANNIMQMGRKSSIYKLDLSHHQQVKSVIQQVYQDFPNLTVLVNNASPFEDSRLLECDEAMFDRYMNAHVKGPFFLTQSFANYVKKGCVVNMVDTYITKHSGRFFTYLLSKKGLADLTTMAAVELGPHIRVNAIAPGSVLPAQDFGDEYMQQKAKQLPLKATPTVENITDALTMLIDKTYLTGQILYVDGGEQLL